MKTKHLTFQLTTKSLQEVGDKGDKQKLEAANRCGGGTWRAEAAGFGNSRAMIQQII
jgi:hypothetical protein